MIALVMLMLLTMLAISSFHLGKGSLEVVGNMQIRNQAVAAAQSAIEEAVSSMRFVDQPNNVFSTPCTVANTRCVDVNGDGTPDITMTLTPAPFCIKAQTIPLSALNLTSADDAACTLGTGQNFGVGGAPSGNSLCANTV